MTTAQCTKCGAEKSAYEFNRVGRGSDKLRRWCKGCNQASSRAASERWVKQHPEAKRRYNKEWRKRYPEKHNAHRAIWKAMKQGTLRRPSEFPCHDCGKPAEEYDHYNGYEGARRWDVQPVCIRCHNARETDRRRRAAVDRLAKLGES